MQNTPSNPDSAAMAASKQTTDNKNHSSWGNTVRTIVVALLLAITFRSLAYEPFHIPSGSMKSNLLIGDYLFVSKYSYGYSRYSFPLGLPVFEGRAFNGKPKRGDVVVFRLPRNPKIDYIKRVMGLPGDRIQLKQGIVYINGKALVRERIADFKDGTMHRAGWRYIETLPEGKDITIMKTRRYGDADNTQLYVVPEKHYFFMGDNRNNSRDSRFLDEVGFVPEENLVGKAQIIFCSVEGGGSCFNPINWITKMRFERIFTFID